MSCTISSGLIRSISLVAGFTFSVSSTLKTCVGTAFAFALSSILPTPLNQYCAPSRFQDDPRAHPIPITIRRGEGGGRGAGRAFMVARVLLIWLPCWGKTVAPHPAGDPKGPHHPASSTL